MIATLTLVLTLEYYKQDEPRDGISGWRTVIHDDAEIVEIVFLMVAGCWQLIAVLRMNKVLRAQRLDIAKLKTFLHFSAFALLITARVWYLVYTRTYHDKFDPTQKAENQAYVRRNIADTTGMMLSQLLIAVITYGLASRKVQRRSLEKLENELFPTLQVEEFDIEDEFQAKIWTQFVREDDIFNSTVADSIAITSFTDSGGSYSINTAS